MLLTKRFVRTLCSIVMIIIGSGAVAQESQSSVTSPKLDAATLRALGIPPSEAASSAEPRSDSGAWSWTHGPIRYDGSGNIATIGTQTFLYDTTGRLASATLVRPDQPGALPQSYTYDHLGNLTSRTTNGALAQSPTDEETNHLETAYAEYDDAGNLIRWQAAAGPAVYHATYDAMGMMQELDVENISGAGPAFYVYTANEERIWSHDAGTNVSHWKLRDLDGKVLRDFVDDFNLSSNSWSVSRDYFYRGSALLAAATSATTLHFSLDQLGSPRVVTDSSRVRVGFHHYLPYGEEWTTNSGAQEGEAMKFTGHERDADVAGASGGLDYMHARYGNPSIGRFLSVDPIVNSGAMTNPQMWNRYAYTANNPMSRVDPDGRNWFNVDGSWEWHKGSRYKSADGVTHRSQYTHLLVAEKVGVTKTGATQFKLTLYNQNQVAGTGTYFSGGGGNARIPAGKYTIRGDIKDPIGPNKINPASPLKNPPVYYGMQVIGWQPLLDSSTGEYYDAFGAYGPLRAYLNPWNASISGSTGNYLHGQAAMGPAAHGYTHGCLCYGQDTTIINYLWKLGEKVPVSVDGSAAEP